MADLITTSDFTDRTGRTLTSTETTQVAALIADASALVRDIADDEIATVPASLIPVVVSMVLRGLDNPQGYASAAIDDFRFEAGASTTGVYATRHEERIIRRAVSKSGVGELNLETPIGAHWRYTSDYWLDGAL